MMIASILPTADLQLVLLTGDSVVCMNVESTLLEFQPLADGALREIIICTGMRGCFLLHLVT